MCVCTVSALVSCRYTQRASEGPKKGDDAAAFGERVAAATLRRVKGWCVCVCVRSLSLSFSEIMVEQWRVCRARSFNACARHGGGHFPLSTKKKKKFFSPLFLLACARLIALDHIYIICAFDHCGPGKSLGHYALHQDYFKFPQHTYKFIPLLWHDIVFFLALADMCAIYESVTHVSETPPRTWQFRDA